MSKNKIECPGCGRELKLEIEVSPESAPKQPEYKGFPFTQVFLSSARDIEFHWGFSEWDASSADRNFTTHGFKDELQELLKREEERGG